MPRIFKGIESELRLLLHPCILTGEITDIKVALFTNDPSVAIEFTDRYTIDDNILTLKVPTWAFGTMEDGVINYVIQGMHNDDAFITDRQSNYYLKTPTDYIPEEMPKEVVLGELTTMIVENGVFEYTPTDVDAWNKATIEVNVPSEGGTCNLGEGEILLDTSMAGTYELYASDDGYDGWSKFYVTLENGGAIKIHKAEELIQWFNDGGDIDFGAYHYVGGKITEIQEINVEFGNATYILDNGFKVYRGDWIDGSNFYDENQIKVGAYIVVYGIIQDYRGELQLKAHSQVIAYQECEGGEIVSCNIQDYKWVRPSMADRAENGDIYIYPDEGFDAVGYIDLDPSDIYNEAFAQGKAEGKAEGGDNYNRVFANTFELQQYMEAQSITELNGICVFGAVGAIQNISDGKATYFLDSAMVVNGSRFDYDPDFDETKLKEGAQIALKGDVVYNSDAEYVLTINNSFLINYELGQAKRYTATSNGSVYIDPDYDKGYTKLNTVILDVEVEGGANLSEFYGRIKENGTYEYLPSDTGVDGFSKVTINANIPTPKASVKTEAEVKSIIDTDGKVENVYIQGAVTEIEQYRNGRLTFWIGGLRIGNAKDVGGINFTDENKIKVGDNIIIFSTSGMYAITRERYEFSNCELIAICANENGGSCNLEDKWVTPSMTDRDDNGYVVTYPSEGFDGLSRVVIDPTTIYNEGENNAGSTARVLEVTENGTYQTKFSDPIIPLVTGVYDDGTEFYSYARLNGAVYNTKIAGSIDSRLEFWYKGDNTRTEDGFNLIIGSGDYDNSDCFQVRYYMYSNDKLRIELGSSIIEVSNWDDTVWHHLIISKAEGLWIDGEKRGDFSSSNTINGEFFINGINYDKGGVRKANGTFGMIKIDNVVIIPTADGFLNVNTGELLEIVQDGIYGYTENLPKYGEGELFKTINVDVAPKINIQETGVKLAYSTFTEVPDWVDFDGITDLSNMFNNCSNLKSIEWFNTELVTKATSVFSNCGQLKTLPNNFNFGSCTDMNNFFANSNSLDDYSFLETWVINPTATMDQMISNTNTTYVPAIPCVGGTSYYESAIFWSYSEFSKLTYFGGWIGRKYNITKDQILKKFSKLTYESCISILNNLYDFTSNGETPGSNQGILKVHQNFLDTVGDDISIGTNKGWTITA